MIDKLQQDIQRLIALYEGVKAENSGLKSSLEEAAGKITSLEEQIDFKNREIESLKLKAAISGGAGSDAEAKKKVEELVRRIDACIKMVEEM